MVTVENIKTLNRDEWDRTIVRNIITPINDDLVVYPENNVSVAIKKIFQNGIGRVLVMDGEVLVGIVSRTDILNYIRIHSQLED
jgi:CBS domain-containing protein